MTEDRFELDVREVVLSLAPDDVPVALPERLASVTANSQGHRFWLGRGRRLVGAIAIAAIVVLALVGFVLVPMVVGPAQTPAPSSVLGSLVEQTDGKFGYQALRPADWTANDAHDLGRIYSDTPVAREARLLLSVNNLAIAARNEAGLMEWWEFLQAGNLEGWASSIEQSWRHDAVPFTVLESPANAKVYYRALPDGSQPMLVAYVVDGGQPLLVGLGGGAAQPSFEALAELRANGAVGDFTRIVGSVRAIPEDPGNVSPPLPGALIPSLVQQIDGRFGYSILRPAGWTAHDGGGFRGYLDASDPADTRVSVTVTNYAVLAAKDPTGIVAQWDAFRRDSSLDGWTAGVERSMHSNGIDFTLVETLPNAKIYLTTEPGSSGLKAYIIDKGQPLGVGLVGPAAHPSLEPLDQLRADGTYDDFVTIVNSVRAIPFDPSNVSPPLD
jgi:hypothetical protein